MCLRLLWAKPPGFHRGSAPGPRWELPSPRPLFCPFSKFMAIRPCLLFNKIFVRLCCKIFYAISLALEFFSLVNFIEYEIVENVKNN